MILEFFFIYIFLAELFYASDTRTVDNAKVNINAIRVDDAHERRHDMLSRALWRTVDVWGAAQMAPRHNRQPQDLWINL